jgi:ABC-type Fe3+ transport system permease subunit
VLDAFVPLSRNDGIVIASRILTAYFLMLLMYELLNIPGDVYHVWHYGHVQHWDFSFERTLNDEYFRSTYVLLLCVTIIKAALAFLAAGWAYRCGPGIGRFFSASDK